MQESHSYSDESKKAVKKAMDLLLRGDRTEAELRDRLNGYDFEPAAVDEAIGYVKSFGYIDDLRYAKTYIDYHRVRRSRKELKHRLRDKGVSDEIISEAFLEYDEADDDPELASMQQLIAKRLKGRQISELDYNEKAKHMRYLAGRGYPSDKIRRLFS